MKRQIAIVRLIIALICSPAMAEDGGEVVYVNPDYSAGQETVEHAIQQDQIEQIIENAETDVPVKKPFVSCNGKATAPIRIIMDITRGIQTASVYEGDKLIHTHKISGGRNAKEYNEREGRVCSFTSVGEAKPKAFDIDRVSRAHGNYPMQFYVDIHPVRAVGAHQGNTGGYSGGCIRQSRTDAKWLYEYVLEHSNTFGSAMDVSCSDVTFEIVDNSIVSWEGKKVHVSEARKKCFASLGKPDPVLVLPPDPIAPVPHPAPLRTGDPLPSNKFSHVLHDPVKYEQQYKYLNEGPPWPEAAP